MKFDKHLFISYAHIDNLPVGANPEGWVKRLHKNLESWLTMRLGCKAEIWRDEKLAGDDIFSDVIVEQFPKVAFLLCILSPRYMESDWCQKEIQKFCEVAERNAGLRVGNKYRVIKVIKAPFDQELPVLKKPPLSEVIRTELGYKFYEVSDDGIPVEFDPDPNIFGQELAEKFNREVVKLAQELSVAWKQIERAGGTQPALEKPAVYLAESSYDQRTAREALETELKCRGYSVLPDQELSRDEDKYVAEVAELLERCGLSIHLVGSGYGQVPDGPSEKSVVILQNDVAARHSRRRGLKRIIWLPDGTEPKGDKQKDFIYQLHTNADAQIGADLITAKGIETVKNSIQATLFRMQTPSPEPGAPTGKLIYVICDEKDREKTIPLRMFIRARGYEVKLPVFEGDAAEVRTENERLLQECKAVILFYGGGTEAWKRSVEGEVRKLRIGPTARVPLWTYVAGPDSDDKRDLIAMREPRHIDCRTEFTESVVQSLLQELESLPS